MIIAQPLGFWSRLGSVLPRPAARPRGAVTTHSFTMQLYEGRCEVVDRPNPGVEVRCKSGRLWITHDGDPKDVVLGPDQTYVAQHPGRMTLHALQGCEMEMRFSALV
jgi:hypothetical protein